MTNSKKIPKLTMEFRRSRHQQQIGIGRPSRPNGICKKHPKHQQSPGVCSVCLSEKLSQLSTSSSRSNTTTTTGDSSCSSSSLSSISSPDYSASASSCSSPVHRRHYYRMASDGRGLSMNFFRSGKNMLTKSRSVAFITKRRYGGEVVAMDHGKKKTSFWSKLLRPRRKRIDEDLVHSRTITRVH